MVKLVVLWLSVGWGWLVVFFVSAAVEFVFDVEWTCCWSVMNDSCWDVVV